MRSVFVVKSSTMGDAPEELGRTLIGSFLRKLWAEPKKPDAIVFYGEGVKLLAEGSHVLDSLSALQGSGVELIGCGTCLGFFDLLDRLAVGRVGNMQEIVALLLETERVVTI